MKCGINVKMFIFFVSFLGISSTIKSQESYVDQLASCVDFVNGGEKELIRVLAKDAKETLEDVDIVVEVNAQSVIDTLIPVIWARAESIIDFSDNQAQILHDTIDESTQKVFDALDDLFGDIAVIANTIIRHNLSKSGQFPVANIISDGYYALRGDTNLCFTIDADNVTIDLNDFTISCTGIVITIAPGRKNIEIKNGKIKSFNQNLGITIGSNCELVSIEDVTIFDCGVGMEFKTQNIKGCTVKNCEFQNCVTCVFAQGLLKSVFKNCAMLNSKNNGFKLLEVSCCLFDNCKILSVGPGGTSNEIAIESNDGSKNIFSECVISGVEAEGGKAAAGFLLRSEDNSKVVDCIINGVTSSALSIGVDLALNSGGCILENNEVLNVSGPVNLSWAIRDSGFGEANLFIGNIAYNGINTVNFLLPLVANVYEYDHDGNSNPIGGLDPFNLDNISVVES